MNTIGREFLSTAIRRLKFYKDLGERAFAQLGEDDFHYMANESSNSIAVIIQHLAGNMLSRWTNFLTEDGEKEWRKRDDEFAIHRFSRGELVKLWKDGWICFLNSLESLLDEDLTKTVYIRQEGLSVIDAINRQLAHYPYHVGQIAYIARLIKDNEWQSLSIAKGQSQEYNINAEIKDPAKKF